MVVIADGPDRHADRGGPFVVPVIHRRQPTRYLHRPTRNGVTIEVCVGDREVVEDVKGHVDFHDTARVPVQDHRRQHPQEKRLISDRAPWPQQVGGLVSGDNPPWNERGR